MSMLDGIPKDSLGHEVFKAPRSLAVASFRDSGRPLDSCLPSFLVYSCLSTADPFPLLRATSSSLGVRLACIRVRRFELSDNSTDRQLRRPGLPQSLILQKGLQCETARVFHGGYSDG